MANISVDCPFCMTKNSYFRVALWAKRTELAQSILHSDASHRAACTCSACGEIICAYFDAPDHFAPSAETGDMNTYRDPRTNGVVHLVGYTPMPEDPTCPAHCPANIERAFLEAERARVNQTFSLAAAGYRKTVDRAVTPLVDEKFKSKMLGQKLGHLEREKKLPEAMIDWISLVKDDGNFAMHDDDRDFDTAEEIQPARDFTRTLLTYLFTLPKQIEMTKAAAEGIAPES